MDDYTNIVTNHTVRWLVHKHHEDLLKMKSVLELKKYVWDIVKTKTTKPDMAKKGLSMVHWNKIFNEINNLGIDKLNSI